MNNNYQGSDYMKEALDPELLRAETKKTVRKLRAIDKTLKFDAIAFRGMSGALRALLVASRLKKSLIMVRKSIKDNHSGRYVEGDFSAKTYIILDDIYYTGSTAKNIVKRIKNAMPNAKCLGLYEANWGGSFHDEVFLKERKVIK